MRLTTLTPDVIESCEALAETMSRLGLSLEETAPLMRMSARRTAALHGYSEAEGDLIYRESMGIMRLMLAHHKALR